MLAHIGHPAAHPSHVVVDGLVGAVADHVGLLHLPSVGEVCLLLHIGDQPSDEVMLGTDVTQRTGGGSAMVGEVVVEPTNLCGQVGHLGLKCQDGGLLLLLGVDRRENDSLHVFAEVFCAVGIRLHLPLLQNHVCADVFKLGELLVESIGLGL